MGETLEVELERVAHGGAAMGHHAGRTIFVHYALPGERVRAQVTDDKGRFAHAIAAEILRASPARVEPRCGHFAPGAGGPDPWQYIDYEQQLAFKQEIVTDQLARVGGFVGVTVYPVLPCLEPWGYRTHMRFEIGPGGELGTWSDDHRRIVPLETCQSLHPALREMAAQFDFDAPGIARVRFAVGSDPTDRLILLETKEDLAPEIRTDLPVSVNLLLRDNEPVNLIGSAHTTHRIFNRDFRATAGAFFQPNAGMVPTLVETVLRRLDLQGSEDVLELYSGVGTLTAFLTERAGLVLSVESYPPAVTDADANTADLDNVELVEGKVEEVLDDLEGPFDAVVADPPPMGLSDEAIAGLGRLSAARLLAIHYDPAALARDAKSLARHGYQLSDVQPIDMFPQSHQVVCVTTMAKG
jgi:tRNA/tmRNA/rRNA uracil-C5-methylase (TrmA/RlmC/RlmD family)